MHPPCHRHHRPDRRRVLRACITIIVIGPIVFAVAAHGFRSSGCGFTTTSQSSSSSSSSTRHRIGLMYREPRADKLIQTHAKGGANDDSETNNNQRRDFIQQSSVSIASLFLPLDVTHAMTDLTEEVTPRLPSDPYIRTPSSNDKFQFSYTVTPPPSFVASNKPLKTHLDEINFAPPDVRGYTLGITVDPVRISSIKQFGTPEEVAARVVTAEVNRDGVFEVTLAKDPKEDVASGGGGYDIEYISDGKRGRKRFVTRIDVRGGFLYVLTVQSKESEYDAIRETEVLNCVKSFKPLS